MTRGWMAAGLVIALVAAAACGKSQEQQAREEAERVAAEAAEAARHASEAAGAGAAAGLEGMAKGLQEMAAGFEKMAEGQADPADFRELQKFFPELSGWTKGRPTGEKMSMGIRMSRAEVTYEKGDASMRMEITDSSLNQAMIAPFAMMLAAGYEKESDAGFERSATIGGQPGWEKWDVGNRSGELNAVVAKRFIVKVDGSNIDDLQTLHQLANAANLGHLASLR
jgi:hypothetical protein